MEAHHDPRVVLIPPGTQDNAFRAKLRRNSKKRVEAIERQTAKVLAREEKKDQEYVSSFLAALRAKAIESMHALLEAEADDDDA